MTDSSSSLQVTELAVRETNDGTCLLAQNEPAYSNESSSQRPVARHQGTLLSTTFNSLCSMIGGGILSLPFITAKASVCVSAVALALAAVMGFASSYFILAGCDAVHAYTYCDLMIFAIPEYNPRVVARALDVVVAAAVFMTQVVYFHVIGQSAQPIVAALFPNADSQAGWFVAASSSYVWIGVSAGLFLCLAPLRTLRELFLITVGGVLVIVYVSLVIIVEYLSGYRHVAEAAATTEPLNTCSLDANALPALTTFVGAFLYQINIPPLYEELGPSRTVRGMMMSVVVTYAVALTLYGAVSLTGYWSFGSAVLSSDVAGNIIANYPSDDRWMTAGRCALTIHLLCASPVYISVGRRSIATALYGSSHTLTLAKHVGIGASFITASALAGVWLPNIGISSQFTGAIFATPISVAIPAWLFYCIIKKRREMLLPPWLRTSSIVTAVAGVVVSVASLVVTIQTLI